MQPGNFEQDALPHLNSAYKLARWLTRNEQDAEDIVQEAYLRALRFYDRFHGGDARPWLLRIVRNVYYTWLKKNPADRFVDLDENLLQEDPLRSDCCVAVIVHKALEALPSRWREVLTLRELEGMSYKEISAVMEAPTGTVMSTLSRARASLRQSLTEPRV